MYIDFTGWIRAGDGSDLFWFDSMLTQRKFWNVCIAAVGKPTQCQIMKFSHYFVWN